jgi:hypothetical protein
MAWLKHNPFWGFEFDKSANKESIAGKLQHQKKFSAYFSLIYICSTKQVATSTYFISCLIVSKPHELKKLFLNKKQCVVNLEMAAWTGILFFKFFK